MKQSCKRYLCLCLVSLFSNTHLLAAEDNTPIQPQNMIMLNSPEYSFEVNPTALFMQPYANNVDYAAQALPFNYGDSKPILSPSWDIPVNRPDYHFGFDIGVAAIIHKTHSTVMLNWQRYHSPDDSHETTVPTADMIGPFFEIGPDASAYKVAKGTLKFYFDEANLNFGTFVQVGERLHSNGFSGVSFVQIKQHNFTRFTNADATTIRTIDVPTKFTGAGPQFGCDCYYEVFRGFQFTGKARTSLYVGTFKNSTTFSTTSNFLDVLSATNPNVQSITVDNKKGIVPGLEGSLGLAYEHQFKQSYMFKLGAGYQAQIYINAIRSIDMGSEVALGNAGAVGSAVVGVYARTFKRLVSDFSMGGPFLTLNVGF